MAISGHKTRHVFDRYNIVADRDLEEAARKVDAFFDAKREADEDSDSAAQVN